MDKDRIIGLEIQVQKRWANLTTPWLVLVHRHYNIRPYGDISVHSIERVHRAMLKLAQEADDEPEE